MNENRASLDEIGRKAGTDKSSAHHDYLQFYERFFSPLRDNPINLLEVGVFHGASLRMWEEYFPHGSVVGADIDRAAVRFRTDRTEIEIVDQSNIQNLIDLGVKRGPFDIVIEDGSHLWEHQITTLRTLFPFVKPGGFYVVEDLQTNFGKLATDYQGISSVTCVEYLKQLVDLRLGDEQIDIKLEEDPFLRTFGRMTEYIAFTRHACLIQKKNISKDPFTSEPLRAVEAVDRSPTLGLVGHIGNIGDAVNDGAAFINIPDSFSGAMQGFQLSISPTLERQIEYRGRLPDGSWTDWQPGNSFVGSRGKNQSLIGAAARLNGELQREFNLELLCRFENCGEIFAAGTGEDCTTETGTQPLRGLQVILSRRRYDMCSEQDGRSISAAQLLVPITSVAGTSDIREAIPKVLDFTEVMYLPTYRNPGPWGIFDAQGAAIEGTVNFLGPGRRPMHQSVTVTPEPAEATCNEPDLVYVGELMNHFGHFLTQTLSRFWYLRERPSARLLFHSRQSKAQLFSIPHVAQIFEALGLREEQFVRFEVPTLVQRLTVPQPSFEEMHFAHQIYAECLREIGAFFTQGDVLADEGPLYLSKVRVGRGVRRLVNEQEMEDEFARQGVRIVHPETLSVAQQIDTLRRHRTLLGCVGSHFHSTTMLPEGRRIVGLHHLENLSSNFLMLDKLSGNKASYYYAPSTKEITKEIADPKFIFHRTFRIDDPVDVARELLHRI